MFTNYMAIIPITFCKGLLFQVAPRVIVGQLLS